MKRSLLIILAIAIQQLSAASLTDKVDKIFARWDSTDSPGCALAVIKDGHIVYKRGYGMADLDHSVPVSPVSIFHVASISKQFTAAAIVLLAVPIVRVATKARPLRKIVSERRIDDFDRRRHEAGRRRPAEIGILARLRTAQRAIAPHHMAFLLS